MRREGGDILPPLSSCLEPALRPYAPKEQSLGRAPSHLEHHDARAQHEQQRSHCYRQRRSGAAGGRQRGNRRVLRVLRGGSAGSGNGLNAWGRGSGHGLLRAGRTATAPRGPFSTPASLPTSKLALASHWPNSSKL